MTIFDVLTMIGGLCLFLFMQLLKPTSLQCWMTIPENISFPKAEDDGSDANFVAALFLYSIFTGYKV